jgi:glucosamine--fructose-6-phosphate aminotransferase (isomerizing)
VGFKHKLLKEIYEQPKAIYETLNKSLNKARYLIREELPGNRIVFLGMGSSYFASIYAKYLFSTIPKMSVDAISAAECLHYPRYIDDRSLIFAISQSGESVETVKLVKRLLKKGLKIWCLTNSVDSSLAKLADDVLLTYAGEEKCSATKTFVATIALLCALWVNAEIKEGYLPDEHEKKTTKELAKIARTIRDKLDPWNYVCAELALTLKNVNSLVVLGRGYNLCAALQGALLFKEVSKIHAEGMMGGDFRHGPIELTSPENLIISLASGRTRELTHRATKAVKTLGGHSILITDDKNIIADRDTVIIDKFDEPLSPILFTIPLELMAYNTAILKGRDPDSLEYVSKITKIE